MEYGCPKCDPLLVDDGPALIDASLHAARDRVERCLKKIEKMQCEYYAYGGRSAPMFNYEVEELIQTLIKGMRLAELLRDNAALREEVERLKGVVRSIAHGKHSGRGLANDALSGKWETVDSALDDAGEGT